MTEQLGYNLLYRWCVGLSPDDAVWDATTLTKNREGEGFTRFTKKLLRQLQELEACQLPPIFSGELC